MKSKDRELNAFKSLFKQTLSASENDNSNGNTQELLEIKSNEEKNTGNNVNSVSSQDSNTSLNDWNSSNGNLSFLPKI